MNQFSIYLVAKVDRVGGDFSCYKKCREADIHCQQPGICKLFVSFSDWFLPYLLVSLTAVSIKFSMAELSAQALISMAALLPLIDLGAAALAESDLAGMV